MRNIRLGAAERVQGNVSMSLEESRMSGALARILCVLAISGGLLVNPPVARAGHSADLASELTTIMSGAGADEYGFLVSEVNGPGVAEKNAAKVFQPASTLKALVALHALQQVQAGAADLEQDTVPRYAMSGSCPMSATSGTETLETAIRLMMRVSDNSSTHALVMHFGVENVNATAAASGLTETRFQTMEEAPGYHKLGCVRADHTQMDPPRVEGNTGTLEEFGAIYGGVADGSLLQGDARLEFSRLTTGRQMFEEEGYDFFQYWPEIVAIADEERPGDVTDHEFTHFLSRLDEHAKGGSYGTSSPSLRWVSFSGILQVPTCAAGTLVDRLYSIGMFFDRVPTENQAALNTAFGNARKAMARSLINDALGDWTACPTPATLDVADASVVYDGNPKAVAVSSDPSGLEVDITYTDADGNPVTAPTNAGSYDVVVTVAEPSQYSATPASGVLTITPAPLTISGPHVTRLYGAADPPLTPHVLGLQGGDTVEDLGPVSCETTATPTSHAGTYPVTCSGAANDNYAITYLPGTLVVTYEVSRLQRPIADPPSDHPTRVKQGSTLPVKFSLLGEGGALPAVLATERASACGVLIAIVPSGDPLPATGTCANYQAIGSEFHTNVTTGHLSPGDHVVMVWVVAGDGTLAGHRAVPISIV